MSQSPIIQWLQRIFDKQLPDNHQVTVSNQISQPLTDAQLRASPVPVSGTFTTTPSGTQDVNVVSSTEIEVTLNGESVELWRGGSQAEAMFVQWSGSQQVAVQGSVQVVTQGNNRLSVDSAQDGAWSVSIDNFPASQTVDGAVSVDNFPTDYATAAKQLPDNHQVTVSNQITQPTTPADTQPVSAASLPLPTGAATAAKQLPNNHDVTVSNFPAEYPLPAAQVSTLTPQTDALTEAQLRTVVPDTAGAWDYRSGISGAPSFTGRVLQITATAGLTAGSFTIDGGNTVTVPAGKSISIEPRGNLSSPTIVFTGTQAYFVEFVA